MRLSPFTTIAILIAFIFNSFGPIPSAQAQDFVLPKPGVMVHLSPPMDPPMLKGIKVHTDNPFRFDFILDKGDSTQNNDQLKDESTKLIKYFLASLTIPEKDLWVNLSPYEKDRIIPESFGLTEMGRDLLAQDYMLKQITASLIYPEEEVGKKFWKRIYEEAQKKYGNTNIPVNTFNKVWIVPEKAVVYENAAAGTAYVVESKLKVMLEQDYLSLEKHEGSTAPNQGKETNLIGSKIVREIVIPELTKEVNENMNFSHLRQVYNSLILATWYKKKIKDSILSQVYTDKNKTLGVNIDDPQEKEKIYQQYLKAFKKGVYNYIKEEADPGTQEMMPRKYFSGGMSMAMVIPISYVNSVPRIAQSSQAMLVAAYLTTGSAAQSVDIEAGFAVINGLIQREDLGGAKKNGFMGSPLYEALRRHKQEQGDQSFLELMLYYYEEFSDPRMKECIEILLGAILRDYRDNNEEIKIPKASIHVFVKMSLMAAKKTLDYVVRRLKHNPTGKVIFFQNLRMGGMYPVMNDRLIKKLGEQGYPVMVIDQVIEQVKEPSLIVEEIQSHPDYQKAAIILVRFKIPSSEVEKLDSSLLQKLEILTLLNQEGIPLVMVDPTKKKTSIAQRMATEYLPLTELFNPKGTFSDGFIGSLANDYYGLDDMEQLLIEESSDAEAGEYFEEFANQAAEALVGDDQFWHGLKNSTVRPLIYTKRQVELDNIMQRYYIWMSMVRNSMRQGHYYSPNLQALIDIDSLNDLRKGRRQIWEIDDIDNRNIAQKILETWSRSLAELIFENRMYFGNAEFKHAIDKYEGDKVESIAKMLMSIIEGSEDIKIDLVTYFVQVNAAQLAKDQAMVAVNDGVRKDMFREDIIRIAKEELASRAMNAKPSAMAGDGAMKVGHSQRVEEEFDSVIDDWLKGGKKEAVVIASDGTPFTFQHYSKNEPRTAYHEIEVFSNNRIVGYIHFSINREKASLDSRFRSPVGHTDLVIHIEGMDRSPDQMYHNGLDAIYVDDTVRKSSIGQFKGIGRSLMGLAERVAYKEGAKRFTATQVNKSIFLAFYNKIGFSPDSPYGEENNQNVSKALEPDLFSRISIELPVPAEKSLSRSRYTTTKADLTEEQFDNYVAILERLSKSRDYRELMAWPLTEVYKFLSVYLLSDNSESQEERIVKVILNSSHKEEMAEFWEIILMNIDNYPYMPKLQSIFDEMVDDWLLVIQSIALLLPVDRVAELLKNASRRGITDLLRVVYAIYIPSEKSVKNNIKVNALVEAFLNEMSFEGDRKEFKEEMQEIAVLGSISSSSAEMKDIIENKDLLKRAEKLLKSSFLPRDVGNMIQQNIVEAKEMKAAGWFVNADYMRSLEDSREGRVLLTSTGRITLTDKAQESNTGGIDLTSNKFLQTQNAGQDIKFHLDPAMLEQLKNAPGFTPVIINIQPMSDLRTFLGLNDTSPAKEPELLAKV